MKRLEFNSTGHLPLSKRKEDSRYLRPYTQWLRFPLAGTGMALSEPEAPPPQWAHSALLAPALILLLASSQQTLLKLLLRVPRFTIKGSRF